MAAVGGELKSVVQHLRALQRRLCRRKRLELAKEEGTSDPREHVMLKVQPTATSVLAVFELSGRNSACAARFLAAKNKLNVAEASLSNSLASAIEDAYLQVPFETIVGLLDSPTCPRHRRDLFAAGRFIVETQLYTWLLAQNKKGVAPGRQQLVAEACRLTPKDLPHDVAAMLEQYWKGNGRARSQRKWLRRFRFEHGLQLGRVRVQAVMPLADMQRKAKAFWRWSNYVHAQSSSSGPLLLLNMDETSIALKPTAKVGTAARGFTGHKAVDAASLAETRARFTLMCTICNDTSVQPFLPQVLLTNGRFLGKKAKVEKLRGNLSVWTQKSAWSCHATLRRYISLLGFKLKAAAPGRDYALLLDCAPSHLHGSIKRQAKLNHIRLVYIAAGLTRCLQPADTDLFSRLKEKIAELYRSQQSMSVDGKISPAQWLEILGSSLQSILPAVKWSRAFAKVGASNWQKDVCQSLLFEFGWPSVPTIPPGPPTESEARDIFPKGRSKLDVLSYVHWKQPAAKGQFPYAFVAAMAAVGGELKSVVQHLRALQRRLCRRKRLELAKEEGTSDPREHVMLKVQPTATSVLAVFELSGRNSACAARFLAAKNKLNVAEASLSNSLASAIEDAYLQVPFETIVGLLDSPTCPRHRRDLFAAGRFIVETQLYTWLLAQNKKGVAPGRQQLVAEACRLTPKDLPHDVAAMLEQYWKSNGRARSQRKWLRRFRFEHGLQLGRVRVQAVMPLADMQRKAKAFWRWSNYVHAQSSSSGPLLLLNMDETSIALKPTAKVGTAARGFTGHKAVDAASLAETRGRFTLMCTICNDTSVQPFLPQVLLTNGRFLGKKAKVEKLRGNLSVWTQKSAWSCHATLRRYISLLGFKLKAAAPGRDYALLLDCAPSHLHGSIKRQAKLNHIRLVYIAAGLTRCLQPADTDLFSRLKEKIAELYRSQQSMSVDGKISPAQWLEILGSSLQSILPAVKWSRAFAKVGASNWQKDVCQSLLFEFGWPSVPTIPPGPPTESEARDIFPKGRSKLDVLSYVHWKQPAAKGQFPYAFVAAMAAVGGELKSVVQHLRALQRRLCRRKRLELAKEEGTSDPREHVMLKVQPTATSVLAVFELSGRNSACAARFLAAKNKLNVAEASLSNSLASAIEDAYLQVPFETIVGLLDSPTCPRHRRDLFAAGRFIVETQLYTWLLAQNKKGVAPGRQQLVAEACRLTPKDLPHDVAAMLEQYWKGNGRARSQRKWLRRFRFEHGLQLGRVRVQAVMPLADMQRKAKAFWRWSNYVHAQSSSSGPLLLLNMDETSIALKPTAKVGTAARGFTGHKAVDAASLAETRGRFTLMCTICNDTSVQPFLPQVLLTNGRFLGKKAKVEKLRGNLSVWTQKSAWSCHATLRRYISLLGFKLKAAAPGRDYALLLDCAPSHLHGSIKRQAKLNHIRLVYIAAGLTRCLQPADTDLFSRLKEKIAELYRSQQSMSVDGKISPAQWLEILGSSLQSILPAVKWSRAFAKVGASNWQKDVCQSLLFEFGWPSVPTIPPGPPTESEARDIFPKGRSKLDVLSYVHWKQPAAKGHVRLYKGKPIRTLD
ncbi:unnamed protein product [Cladocopium goreaui]|uniref:DDE-1 domain-containing protein n=1 Tax=Cladocopium goreaui TaxID=2562237 RepID=A0A9P1DE71_9DINO|nr:unnamed protein product [Cladocopium goreaui]